MKVPRLAWRRGRGPSCQPWPIWSPVSSPLPRHPVQCWCLFIKLWRNVGWQIIKDHFMAWITWYNLFRLLAFVWYQKWSPMWNYHFYANNLLDVKMRGNCRGLIGATALNNHVHAVKTNSKMGNCPLVWRYLGSNMSWMRDFIVMLCWNSFHRDRWSDQASSIPCPGHLSGRGAIFFIFLMLITKRN